MWVLAKLLQDPVVTVETSADPAGVVLFPEEEKALSRAVQKRRREFTTGRDCAHQALARLGHPVVPIPRGARGEPRWPSGVSGSITHCEGYRAAAAARAVDILGIGIDAEPNRVLPDGVGDLVLVNQELAWVQDFTRTGNAVCWDRLVFSIKESVYKAWFPLTRSWLGFLDVGVTVDPGEQAFSARLLAPNPATARDLRVFHGTWTCTDDLLLTATVIANDGSRTAGPVSNQAVG